MKWLFINLIGFLYKDIQIKFLRYRIKKILSVHRYISPVEIKGVEQGLNTADKR